MMDAKELCKQIEAMADELARESAKVGELQTLADVRLSVIEDIQRAAEGLPVLGALMTADKIRWAAGTIRKRREDLMAAVQSSSDYWPDMVAIAADYRERAWKAEAEIEAQKHGGAAEWLDAHCGADGWSVMCNYDDPIGCVTGWSACAFRPRRFAIKRSTNTEAREALARALGWPGNNPCGNAHPRCPGCVDDSPSTPCSDAATPPAQAVPDATPDGFKVNPATPTRLEPTSEQDQPIPYRVTVPCPLPRVGEWKWGSFNSEHGDMCIKIDSPMSKVRFWDWDVRNSCDEMLAHGITRTRRGAMRAAERAAIRAWKVING